jgi:hypothetical protein
MENIKTSMDNQPIAANFFKEGRWLTDYITPRELEVQHLFEEITKGVSGDDRLAMCWKWVANQVHYHTSIYAQLEVMGKISVQKDYWMPPGLTIKIREGNCAVKAFLLASLIRNELPSNQVYCCLGNLIGIGGHAWVTVILNGNEYIMESTRSDVSPLIPAESTTRYEAVHYFNDQETYMIQGKTVMYPITACYSAWLKDYLDWSYIKGKKDGMGTNR